MNWGNLAKWKKNYIAFTFAIWSLTISISMFFYMGTGSTNDLPPAPFVLGFIVFLIAVFASIPIELFFSIREFMEKNGKISADYLSRKLLWLFLDLLIAYYFFDLFFTYKDEYLGFL